MILFSKTLLVTAKLEYPCNSIPASIISGINGVSLVPKNIL